MAHAQVNARRLTEYLTEVLKSNDPTDDAAWCSWNSVGCFPWRHGTPAPGLWEPGPEYLVDFDPMPDDTTIGSPMDEFR